MNWFTQFKCKVFGHRFTPWKEFTPPETRNPFLNLPHKTRHCQRCGVIEFNSPPPKHWNCRCTYTYPIRLNDPTPTVIRANQRPEIT